MLALGVTALLLGATANWVLSWPQFGGSQQGDRLARARANPLYHDGRFVNPVPPAPYTAAYVWALLTGQFGGNEVREPPSALPLTTIARGVLDRPPPAPSLRAFWLGHAGVYAEIDGVRLLFDAVFAEYASPFEAGPRRFHPPPITLQDLPPIDALLVSHDHYDHLDMQAVRHLASRGTVFVVPLGVGAHLQRWGVPAAQVHELEWWQEHVLRGVRLVATPSRHYSGRSIGDARATLWASWSVIGARHRFHVTGDTGYGDHFSAIANKFGPFDLSFVKVGAYGPGAPWLDIHMSAEDAVRAHRELRAKRMVPVHWATFNLAFHAWDEPIRRTVAAARSGAAGPIDLITPRVGDIIDADQPFASTAWWEAVR